jgi:hypothetical protein
LRVPGVPAAWVTADEVYGGNPSLRAWLETHRMPYVLAIRCTEALQVPDGPPTPAKLLAAGVPPERWLTINPGDGAKGKRWYAWTQVELTADGAPAGWAPPAARPPQPAHRSAGLLPLRRPGHTAVGRPGAGGRVPLADRGRHRTRPASPPPGVIALTCSEIAHLFAALVGRPIDDWLHRLRWSWWRRRHQARARRAHYQRQAAQQP